MARALQRPPRGRGRIIAGVCGAIANRLGIPALLIRVIFVIFAFTGAGEIAYIVLWILIPNAPPGFRR